MSRPPKHLSELPSLVRSWMLLHNGLLVGSGAVWLAENLDGVPRDFDVIIPPDQFHDACKLLTGLPVSINSFGGIKVAGQISIDVWSMTLETFIKRCSGCIAVSAQPYHVVRW